MTHENIWKLKSLTAMYNPENILSSRELKEVYDIVYSLWDYQELLLKKDYRFTQEQINVLYQYKDAVNKIVLDLVYDPRLEASVMRAVLLLSSQGVETHLISNSIKPILVKNNILVILAQMVELGLLSLKDINNCKDFSEIELLMISEKNSLSNEVRKTIVNNNEVLKWN